MDFDIDDDDINDNEDVKFLFYNVRPKTRVIVTNEPAYVRKGEEFLVEGYVEYESSPGTWERILTQVNLTVYVNQSGAGYMTSIAQLNPTQSDGTFKITCIIPNEIVAGSAIIVYQVHSNSAYFGCWATKDTPTSAPAGLQTSPSYSSFLNFEPNLESNSQSSSGNYEPIDTMQNSIMAMTSESIYWNML